MTLRQEAPSRFRPLLSTSRWGGRSTRAEISLDAVGDNVAAIRRHVSSRHVMAVVKANAYGHGASPIARAALANGASWIGVYTVDEGVQLRKDGIRAPILIFGAFQPPEAFHIARHRLTPTIHTVQAGRALAEAAFDNPVEFHIKVDTGLSRSGVAPTQIHGLLDALAPLAALRAQGIYTHFARSDEPSRPETTRQLRQFLDIVRRLQESGYAFEIKHAANTGALLTLPDSHLDMVRCGIGTYGYAPSRETQGRILLRPALTLLTTVARVHTVPAGTGVGYGHEFVCHRETRLALVPIGYGDGLPRSAGNGAGRVLIRGQEAPIVGRVSMDQLTVDVTDIPGTSVEDDAILIGHSHGREQDADEFASLAGTISYDVLTGLLPRVPRLYSWGPDLYTSPEHVRGLSALAVRSPRGAD